MPRPVTLSFDNGPKPDVTPFVLDLLARYGVKTTFFLIGERAETPEGMELARRALAEGHQLGNHTYSHKTPLGRLSQEEALKEFDDAAKIVASAGETKKLFRPYGGGGKLGPHLMQPAVVNRLVDELYTCVVWSCVPGDWRDPEGWLARAIEGVESAEWPLVVLHDVSLPAMLHLEAFLQYLKSHDFEIRQDFPPSCTPIIDGRIVASLDGISS